MLFELFCIKNDFPKYFGDVLILLLYCRANQISLGCIILQNDSSGTRVNQIVNKCLNGLNWSFQFVIFSSLENNVYKTFAQQRNG